MKKRILSVLMVLCLVLAAVPTALAGEEDTMPESPGEEAGETTPEGAEPNGDTAPEDGNGETQEETGNTAPSPVNDVAVQAEGDVPQVTMDNMLVKTNSAVDLSYQIPAGYEDQITFQAMKDGVRVDGDSTANHDYDYIRVEIAQGDDGIYTISPYQSKNSVGDVITIQALYNEEVVGECQVYFIGGADVEYAFVESGTIGSPINTASISLPMGIPTQIAVLWELSSSSTTPDELVNATVNWEWINETPDVVGLTADRDNSQYASITYYQQRVYGSISAQPTLQIDGIDYLYNYSTSKDVYNGNGGGLWGFDSSDRYVTGNHFTEGDRVEFTFNLGALVGEAFTADTPVTWSCSNPDLIETTTGYGPSITLQSNFGAISSEGYVRITATATVNEQTYSACTQFYVWRGTLPSENAVKVDSVESLNSAIEAGISAISVTGTVVLTEGEYGLSGMTVYRDGSLTDALFQVAGSVTVSGDENTVIDGQNLGAQAPLIEVVQNGDLTLSDITLQDNRNNGTGGSNSSSQGGAVSVEGGKLTCTGVTFTGDTVRGNTSTGNDYNGGGAIYAYDAVIDISGCTFSESIADFGNGGAIYTDQGTSGTIQNNTFTDCGITQANSTTYNNPDDGKGGAIYCRMPGKLDILGNEITGCTAQTNGGGISVIAGTDSVVTLDGNVIQNCKADERGGGMSLITPVYDPETDGNRRTITLLTGEISGCHASWGGGIDYTGHGMETLYLQNVKITGNRAVRGAGIWACPTSMTDSYTTLGGAIYGNDADMPQGVNTGRPSGDEIRYESGDEQTKIEDSTITRPTGWNDGDTYMTVMDRALGGGLMAWYQDEQDDRYQAGNAEADPSLYTNTSSSFSLHGELSEAHQALAEAEARLIITGNTAESRGGGIATNSPIVIGMEGYDKTVTVEKMWSGSETHPASVNVTLVRKDEAGNTVDLETVTLSEDNEWTATFEDLPGLYEDENGTQHNYTYTVREDTIANWTGKVAETSEGNTIELVITNTYQPDPGPGGGGGTTTPDPDPDDKDDDDPEPTPTPTPTPNPDIPVTPDNPDTPDTPNQPDTPSEPVSPSDPGVPQTSDTSLTGLWLALCLLALGGLGLLRFTQPRRGGRRARR